MLNAHASRVELDLQVGSDRLIELFLIQCHTPTVVVAGAPARLLPAIAAPRLSFVNELCDWALGKMNEFPEDRLFVFVWPELSLPTACLETLKDFATRATHPLIVCAGLEFLEWDDYARLIETEVTYFPGKDRFLEGAERHEFVNTAIVVVRDLRGELHIYLQPKRNPSRPEVPHVFRCQELLLFTSKDQTPGLRLNFTVQICSDFTSAECVRDLRRACAAKAPGAPIDFTFVLQWNEDQDAAQWKQAAAEYFSPPDEEAATDDGALVFVNNSSHCLGKSPGWGRSTVLFHILKKWKADAPPTYWLLDQEDFDHQSATMREHGPGLYWLRYTPHYLVRRRPGGVQPEPFPAASALAAPLLSDNFIPSQFRPIQPVAHWLGAEWKAGRLDFESLLTEVGVQAHVEDPVRVECMAIYDALLEGWSKAFGLTDALARQTAATYFECIDAKWFPFKTYEPKRWCERAERAMQRFQVLLSIMSLAGNDRAELKLRPSPSPALHAITANGIPVTLLWGAGERTARSMMATHLGALRSRSPIDELAPQALLVLVEPRDPPQDPQAASSLLRQQVDITRAVPGEGVPSRLASGGAAVNACADTSISCLCDSHVFTAFTGAVASGGAPREAIRAVIEQALG